MPERSENQTISFLMRRFREAGIAPRTKLGQNFLIDLNLQSLLVDTAQIQPNDVILEVGTGTGSLTVLLAQKAAAVVTLEIDRDLFTLAGEELHELDNVAMLRLDVLKNKNRLEPLVLEAIDAALSIDPKRHLKLVSNLPFQVATPILTNLLATERPPSTMTVTIQKELADRIVAQPRTKDYGALSIWIQSQCQVQIVRTLAPTVFWPRPKVHSAIVHISLDPALRNRIFDRPFFHRFVRAMFFHRRKFLRSELESAFKKKLSKAEADSLLTELGLATTARAEELDVETMLNLSHAVQTRLGSDSLD